MMVSTGIQALEGSYWIPIYACFLQSCQVPLLMSDVTVSVIDSGEFLGTALFIVITEREAGGWISTNPGLTPLLFCFALLCFSAVRSKAELSRVIYSLIVCLVCSSLCTL